MAGQGVIGASRKCPNLRSYDKSRHAVLGYLRLSCIERDKFRGNLSFFSEYASYMYDKIEDVFLRAL